MTRKRKTTTSSEIIQKYQAMRALARKQGLHLIPLNDKFHLMQGQEHTLMASKSLAQIMLFLKGWIKRGEALPKGDIDRQYENTFNRMGCLDETLGLSEPDLDDVDDAELLDG